MFDFSVDKVEKSVKDSLRKLRLSYVDLIQVLSKTDISPFSSTLSFFAGA